MARLFSLISAMAIVGVFVASSGQVNGARRTCTNLFSCMPYLFTIPFKEIANATYYYTGSMLKLSQISDEDWDSQMGTLNQLCNIWLTFDQCMDRDWIECIDWDQLASLVQVVGGIGDATTGNTNSAEAVARRQQALNNTRMAATNAGWSMDNTKMVMKIGTNLCSNIKTVIPSFACFRDLLLSNETLVNSTLRYQAIVNAGCGTMDLSCENIEKVNHIFGHWLYHGCEQGTEKLIEFVRILFQGISFSDDALCSYIYQGKTARDMYEAPYDRSLEKTFGYDLSRCNETDLQARYDAGYKKYVGTYMTSLNLTRETFYHQMACKLKKMDLATCDIWPVSTTRMTMAPTTTTTTRMTTTSALVPTQPAVQRNNALAANSAPANRLVQRTTKPAADAQALAQASTTKNNKNNNKKTTKRPMDDDEVGDHSPAIHADRQLLTVGVLVSSIIAAYFQSFYS